MRAIEQVHQVFTEQRTLEAYRHVVGGGVDELRRLAEPLRGARVLHLNSTAVGGGVAEILRTMVPLLNDLGIRGEWAVMRGEDEFFGVTKLMHNLLQGMPAKWTPELAEVWRRYNEMNAGLLSRLDYDYIWVHDPQPLGVLASLNGSGRGAWVWRCHIDLSDANVELWDFLQPYMEPYDAVVFTLPEYLRDGIARPQVFTTPPAIDPLSAKNQRLSKRFVRETLERRGIDPNRPVLLQVSRFDPWKDPLGAIDVYREVKRRIPSVQMVFVASMAHDDPEGWLYFERTARKAGEDFDIHMVNGDDPLVVNAFQRAADVVLQMSTREGFGLVVSEALWKKRPVVARGVGGIPLQVIDGKTGFLVDSPSDAAECVLGLLESPHLGEEVGVRARNHVKKNFLVTRYLADHLDIMQSLSGRSRRTVPGNGSAPASGIEALPAAG